RKEPDFPRVTGNLLTTVKLPAAMHSWFGCRHARLQEMISRELAKGILSPTYQLSPSLSGHVANNSFPFQRRKPFTQRVAGGGLLIQKDDNPFAALVRLWLVRNTK